MPYHSLLFDSAAGINLGRLISSIDTGIEAKRSLIGPGTFSKPARYDYGVRVHYPHCESAAQIRFQTMQR